jgi:hypothetical protein
LVCCWYIWCCWSHPPNDDLLCLIHTHLAARYLIGTTNHLPRMCMQGQWIVYGGAECFSGPADAIYNLTGFNTTNAIYGLQVPEHNITYAANGLSAAVSSAESPQLNGSPAQHENPVLKKCHNSNQILTTPKTGGIVVLFYL